MNGLREATKIVEGSMYITISTDLSDMSSTASYGRAMNLAG